MKATGKSLVFLVAFLLAGPIAKAGYLNFLNTPLTAVKKVWIFDSKFKGELSTRLAIAEAFPQADISTLSLSKDDQTLSLKDFLIENFGSASSKNIVWPDVIIHSFAQPGEIDLLLELKKRSKHRSFIVNFGDPGSRRREIDLIVSPKSQENVLGENVLRPLALPSRLSEQTLKEAYTEWRGVFENLPRPIISVFIGGQTREKGFPSQAAKELAAKVLRLAKASHGSLLVTSSNRTPEHVTKAFLSEISGVPFYFYDARNAPVAEPNPYNAFFAFGDYLIVTGDSLSMVSAATSTGKPVLIYTHPAIMEERHKRLVLDLAHSGRVRALAENLQDWSYKPLNVTGQIANAVNARRNCNNFLRTLRARMSL